MTDKLYIVTVEFESDEFTTETDEYVPMFFATFHGHTPRYNDPLELEIVSIVNEQGESVGIKQFSSKTLMDLETKAYDELNYGKVKTVEKEPYDY